MPEIMVTTMNDLPGHRVDEVFGEVFGLTVRSRNIGSDIGAQLKGLVGGEVKGYTKMLADSRLQAVERLRDAAREVGGERRDRDALRLQRAWRQHDRGRRLRHRRDGEARLTAFRSRRPPDLSSGGRRALLQAASWNAGSSSGASSCRRSL